MRISGVVMVLICFSLTTPYSGLANMSEWHDMGGARARLVVVLNPVGNNIEGVIDVELKPGWVTYWRSPGQAGIPPVFDFSMSSGVMVDLPDFPVPTVKKDSGMVSVVYKDRVRFPFKVKPLTSPPSGKLLLNLLLGVCREICIPASASFSHDLPRPDQNDPEEIRIIEQAKRKLPVIQTNGGEWSGESEILDIQRLSNSSILVRVRIPVSVKKIELLAEARHDRFFDPAKLLSRKDGLALFELNLSTLPKSFRMNAFPLRLTLITDGAGSEKTIVVDKI